MFIYNAGFNGLRTLMKLLNRDRGDGCVGDAWGLFNLGVANCLLLLSSFLLF